MVSRSKKSVANHDSSSSPLVADNGMGPSNPDHAHPALNNASQNVKEEDDDTSMYFNLLPGDEQNDEHSSHNSEKRSSISNGQQFGVSTHQSADITMEHDSDQDQVPHSQFDPMDLDSDDTNSPQPTPNEVAAAVAAAASGFRHVDDDNANSDDSIQQDANSEMVTAAAAEAAKVAAAAAADSTRESDSEELDTKENLQKIGLDSGVGKSKHNSNLRAQNSKKSYSETSKNLHQDPIPTNSDSNDAASIKTNSGNNATKESSKYSQDNDLPWPIDKQVSETEFRHVPRALREYLIQSSEYANGLTYISQLQSQPFPSKNEAINHLKTFAYNEGFSIKGVETESTPQRLVYACANSQQYEIKSELGSLKRSADSEDTKPCKFRVTITFDSDPQTWNLESSFSDHNHGPTGPAASAKRSRLTYFQKTLRDDFVPPKFPLSKKKDATIPSASSIFTSNSSLQSEEANQTHNGKHVDNLRGLVGALRFDNAYIIDRMDKDGAVTHLFWTNQECMDMLQLFPEVLFINVVQDPSTLPLVHIVGITCFNTTFEIGYGYLKTYALEGLVWVINSFKEMATKVLQRQKPYQPSAVIIHHDLKLMGAVELHFEHTCQFCVSQLMRDVNEKAVSFFSDPKDRKRFIEDFQRLVDSETADIYAFNEEGFRKEYQGTKILDYVTYHWLHQKKRFVRAWVDQHLHFNNYSMGKAEIAQSTVANYVRECDGDILKLYYRISGFLKRRKEEYEERVKQEQKKCPLKFFVPFFNDVRFQISAHALELIKEQHELHLEAQSSHEKLSRCTSMFTNTTGLPCKHTLARPPTMDDIHPHWWLQKQKHYRVPLSAHESKLIEVSSKFERALSFAKQHFNNMLSLDMKEAMLSDVMKYFSGIGVPGIDEVNTLSSGNLSKGSPLLSSRATPPSMSPSTHHHLHNHHQMLSGSASPIHVGARVSSLTTNLHKNSVNGVLSPAQHVPINSSGNGALEGATENGGMYLNLREGQDGSNGSTDGQYTGEGPHGGENSGDIEDVIGNNMPSTSRPNGSTMGNTFNRRHQTRNGTEFNELAAAAAAAAEAEENGTSNKGGGTQLLGTQYHIKGRRSGNNSSSAYPASIANIMNSPNPGTQIGGGYYSRQATGEHLQGTSYPGGNAGEPEESSGRVGSSMAGGSHNEDAVSAARSILQVSGSNHMVTGTPRKCGKCNQIGHNSRTCGQRISFDGL